MQKQKVINFLENVADFAQEVAQTLVLFALILFGILVFLKTFATQFFGFLFFGAGLASLAIITTIGVFVGLKRSVTYGLRKLGFVV